MISTTQTEPLQQEIEQYAYFLYEQRGCQPGHELEDWLEAEKQLVSAVHGTAEAKVANPTKANPLEEQQANSPVAGPTRRQGRKAQRIEVY